jgi:hypothetical protein
MKLRDLEQKYRKIVNELNSTRESFAMTVASDALALVANRVQNKGINADGEPFSSYSQTPMAWWFLDSTKFQSPNKIEKFKDRARKETAKAKKDGKPVSSEFVSYAGLRKFYGLVTTVKNFTFSGVMFSSIHPSVTKKTLTSVTVSIASKDDFNQGLINKHSSKEKISIIALNDQEKEMITQANIERLKKMIYGT